MAINLGDAVLAFRGDLTQLNLAFDEAANSATKLAPAQAQVDAVAGSFDRAATAAEVATVAMKEAGTAGAQAGSQVNAAWLKVANATFQNSKAQQELRAALYAVKSTGGDSAAAMERYAIAQERAALTAKELAEAQGKVTVAAGAMATEIEVADAAFNMHEAKASIALIGEEVGVKIPRHLRGFVANLPGVGKALETAFSGVAILILVQLLAEGTQKLAEFISETFIFTEANKKAYESEVELNKAIDEQNKKLKELKKAYEEMGLTPLEKAGKSLKENTKEIERQEQAWHDAKAAVDGYDQQLREAAAAAEDNGGHYDIDVAAVMAKKAAAESLYAQLFSSIRTLRQQDLNDQKTYDQQALDDLISHGQAANTAAKTIGDARISLLQAQSRLQSSLVQASYFEQGQAEAGFEQMKYELELSSLERQRDLLAKDPTKNADRVKELNAQIEALEIEHAAKLINNATSLRNKVIELARQAKEQPIKFFGDTEIKLDAPTKEFDDLLKTMQQFGIQGSAVWTQMVSDAQKAYEQIKASGLTTYGDLLQAEEKLVRAKLGQALAFGEKAEADQFKARIEAIVKELQKLGIETDKTANKNDKLNRSWNNGARALDLWGAHLRKNRGELTNTEKVMDDVIASSTSAFESAVQAWVLGQDSLGNALRKGLAAEAANIAGRAAMWGAYWLAWGIVDTYWAPERAAAEFTAAAEFFAVAAIAGAAAFAIAPRSSSSAAGSTDTTANGTDRQQVTADPNPVQRVNVQHFATGGLITQRTLAVVGDAASGGGNAREGIIPLDDPQATAQIAEALGKNMGGGGNTYIIQGMISPDNLKKVIKQINGQVTGSNVKLTATTSRRVVRK